MLIKRILRAISLFNVILLILNPVEYRVESKDIDDLPQKIYTLKMDMSANVLDISNILSFDVLYGFERASDMAKRHDALFAVNGMFYDLYGMPYGIMIEDGKVISMSTIYTPTVVITYDGKVTIEEIYISGRVEGGTKTVYLSGTNCGVDDGAWVLFDSIYGSTTRVSRMSMNYLITDNTIVDIIQTDEPVNLNGSDYVLTQVTPSDEKYFKIGDKVKIVFEATNGFNNIDVAFQTGGWLVKDGVNVAKEYEAFTGATTAPSPRTLVGITEDQKLVFKVIDGRNKGVSVGVSGYQAAQLMIEEGCIAAAYLDGGASSTLVVGGEVVNRPSNEGQEREIAHSIIIRIKDFLEN